MHFIYVIQKGKVGEKKREKVRFGGGNGSVCVCVHPYTFQQCLTLHLKSSPWLGFCIGKKKFSVCLSLCFHPEDWHRAYGSVGACNHHFLSLFTNEGIKGKGEKGDKMRSLPHHRVEMIHFLKQPLLFFFFFDEHNKTF